MIRNRLGRPARFLMVATAVACWIPCVPAEAAGMPLPQAPGRPTGLTATPEGTSVRLRWTAPTLPGGSPAITGYLIEMYSNAHPAWVVVVANTGSPAAAYLHANPPRNTIVWYRVAAISAAGTGEYSFFSNQVNTTGSTGPGTPGAPRNLTAAAVGTAINLNWDEPFPTPEKTISGYQVNVSTNGGRNFAFLTNTTATEHRHSGLPVGATRHYEVRALYSDNTVGPPAYAHATTVATGIPGAPQNLSATAAGPTAIDVDWDAPASPGASAIIDYQVEVSTTGGVPWTLLTTTGQTSFRHTNLTAGATRHYRVRARNANDFGPWTSAVSATTSTGTPPGPPRALTATAVGSSAIDLSWSAPQDPGSSGIIGYRIEWSSTRTATGVWTDLEANTGNTRTTYRDTGLAPNTERYYRVSAINSFATGIPSSIEGAITEPDVPDAPGRLTAQARGISAIELAWTAPPSRGAAPVTGYRIQWSSTGTGGWRNLVADTGLRTTRHTDTGLSPRTKALLPRRGAQRGAHWRLVERRPRDHRRSHRSGRAHEPQRDPERPQGQHRAQPPLARPVQHWREPHHRLPHRVEFHRYLARNLPPARPHRHGHHLRGQRPRPQHDPVLSGARAQRPGAGGPLDRCQRHHQRRAARPAPEPARAGGGTDQHHPQLGGAGQRRRGADHRLHHPEARPRRKLDHDPSQYGSAGDHIHGHGPPAGHRLPVPGGGGQPPGSRPVVVRGEHEHLRPGSRRTDRADGPGGGHRADRPVVECAPQHRRRPHPCLPDRGLGATRPTTGRPSAATRPRRGRGSPT